MTTVLGIHRHHLRDTHLSVDIVVFESMSVDSLLRRLLDALIVCSFSAFYVIILGEVATSVIPLISIPASI